ncbi:acetate--CoA ligase family protein [Stella sp.]|uniref:acetate--CoA ligase family protein n=1 Tax=Stella sp. TaxID=2912054 RepID=UPI0035B2B3C7
MSGPTITVRQLAGPSLESDRSVTLLELAGIGPDGRAMDDQWLRRWRTAARSVGIALPPAEPQDPGHAAALAAEAIASGVLDRPAAPVRPGRHPSTYVLTALPAPIATRIVHIAVGIVDLTRAGTPAPPVLARVQSALRALAAVVPAMPGQVRDPTSLVLAEAAERLGVPWRWSAAYPGRLAVGEGRRQTLFDGSGSLSAPVLGSVIAGNKLASKRYMEAFQLPTVPDRIVARPDAAAAAAAELGFPVAVKPVDGSRGKGVSLDVRTPEAVRIAAEKALAAGGGIMIEPYVPLPDFRAIVVGGEVAMVFQRHAAYVTGDGRATVEALLAELNRAVAEQRQPFPSRYPVPADDDLHRTLANAGLALDAVPDAGRRVVLRTCPMRHYGGYTLDVTPQVHPSIAAILGRLAAVTRLPVIGVDLRCEAIDRPWDGQRFVIIEFNDRTDLSSYPGHPMQDMVIRTAAPDADSVRLPTLLMVDPEPGQGPALLQEALAARRMPVAVAGPRTLYLGGLAIPVAAGAAHLRMVEDPTLAVAVHWTTPAVLAAGGLGTPVIDRAWFAAGADDPDRPALEALVRRHARIFQPLPAAEARMAVLLAAAADLSAGAGGP